MKTARPSLDEVAPALLARVAESLRVLAHPERLKIVDALREMGEAPVGSIVERLGRPQAAVSLHLSQLRRVGLVAGDRRGREVWYRVDNPRVFTMLECIRKGCGG